jgi:hypothetical protein
LWTAFHYITDGSTRKDSENIHDSSRFKNMKTLIFGLTALSLALSARSSGLLANALTSTTKGTEVVAWDQIGLKASANYHGDGLTVMPDAKGARLHCVFQRLDGEATPEGLWLTSTVTNHVNDRFEVKAVMLTRQVAEQAPGGSISTGGLRLSGAGEVSMQGQTVRLSRPGLVEEYRVSMDGLSQDFLVTEKLVGSGDLEVRLAVVGARVDAISGGAQLTLEQSGRKIAYSRIRATDATGRELPARIEVERRAGSSLAVVVSDANAVYPVRIDPTFSDANWIAVGSGTGGAPNALAVSGDTLYAGGYFTTAGGTPATNIAQWNGTGWSALGSGMAGPGPAGTVGVFALAASGGVLYAGGNFTSAGGIGVNHIARWDGSTWSPLSKFDSGLTGGDVDSLAISDGTLYAGGSFTAAGARAATNIAQWDGTNWSPLGSGLTGVGSAVFALAVSGDTLYAGGRFTAAGGIPATNIAQWNGSNWSALGSGLNAQAAALAISGGTLYVGGYFTTAGGTAASNIAQWNGSNWSGLGSGMSGPNNVSVVYALAVSGGMLYAGGGFTNVSGTAANNIAQWNGSSWSALGSGMNAGVYALAASDGLLYAGGAFSMAGTNAATRVAAAVLGAPVIVGNPTYSPAQGSLTLNLATSSNLNSRLWMTTDLTPPVVWQPIYTNLSGGLWQFTDTNTANFNVKFYELSTP